MAGSGWYQKSIINVSIKADPQFSGDCSQGHEVSRHACFLGVRAETDIPFTNSLADSQFGYVVGYCCRFNGVSLHIHAHNQSIPDIYMVNKNTGTREVFQQKTSKKNAPKSYQIE